MNKIHLIKICLQNHMIIIHIIMDTEECGEEEDVEVAEVVTGIMQPNNGCQLLKTTFKTLKIQILPQKNKKMNGAFVEAKDLNGPSKEQ